MVPVPSNPLEKAVKDPRTRLILYLFNVIRSHLKIDDGAQDHREQLESLFQWHKRFWTNEAMGRKWIYGPSLSPLLSLNGPSKEEATHQPLKKRMLPSFHYQTDLFLVHPCFPTRLTQRRGYRIVKYLHVIDTFIFIDNGMGILPWNWHIQAIKTHSKALKCIFDLMNLLKTDSEAIVMHCVWALVWPCCFLPYPVIFHVNSVYVRTCSHNREITFISVSIIITTRIRTANDWAKETWKSYHSC